MDNLRLTLLIIGCFIVLGIYLWEVFYKGVPKKKTDILDAVDEIPDMPVYPINNEADDFSAATSDLGSLLTQSRNQGMSVDDTAKSFDIPETSKNFDEPAKNQDMSIDEASKTFNVPEAINNLDEANEDLPLEMSVKDYEKSLSDNNDYDVFAAIEDDIHKQEEFDNKGKADSEITEQETELPENNQDSEDLLVLYITSPTHTLFNGLSISKAADEVGMVYGHMNIFHHFGPGKLHSGQPLFSIANMHEPGSFDLGRMADLKTKGIAAFMYSPASIDASVVFELFLNTTQRIAELLGGDMRTPDNKLLNSAAINSLREKAESLSVN
jgi:cell division protein ZipA